MPQHDEKEGIKMEEKRNMRGLHTHLHEIDFYILNILKSEKKKRLTVREILNIMKDNGKTWHKSYVVRRLLILRTFGMIGSPARGLYEINENGKEIVKNSKNSIKIVFNKPKNNPKVAEGELELPHLRNLDKKIICFLAKDKKAHTLGEIEKALQKSEHTKIYKTIISNRLRVLDLLGITNTERRDEHAITYYGSEVYKALKKEKGGK